MTFPESVMAKRQFKKVRKRGTVKKGCCCYQKRYFEMKLVFCRLASVSFSLYFVVFFLLFLIGISAGGVRVRRVA